MAYPQEEMIVHTRAVEQCVDAFIASIESTGTATNDSVQAILREHLGTDHPRDLEFEEAHLLVKSLVNRVVAPEFRKARSAVIMWLNGAPLETGGV